MDVKEIVIKHLEDLGAAGLCDVDVYEGCSCTKDDLFACGDYCLIGCIPMYEIKCKRTGNYALSAKKIDNVDEASEFVEKYGSHE